jgi:hypothetical protein
LQRTAELRQVGTLRLHTWPRAPIDTRARDLKVLALALGDLHRLVKRERTRRSRRGGCVSHAGALGGGDCCATNALVRGRRSEDSGRDERDST